MDWYPWYPQLFHMDTLHLSLAQECIYRRLIDWYMTNRHPIPNKDQAIAAIARIGLNEWLENASEVRKFFQTRGGHLHLKRCDEQLDAQDKRAKRRSEVAKKGAQARHKISVENIELVASSKPPASFMPATRQDKTEEILAKASPKKLLPADFTLTPDRILAAKRKGIENVQREWEQFTDHHTAKASRFADWNAAWRTWCGNAAKYANSRRVGGRGFDGSQKVNGSVSRAAMAVIAAGDQCRLRASGMAGGGSEVGNGDGFQFGGGAAETSNAGGDSPGNFEVLAPDENPRQG